MNFMNIKSNLTSMKIFAKINIDESKKEVPVWHN